MHTRVDPHAGGGAAPARRQPHPRRPPGGVAAASPVTRWSWVPAVAPTAIITTVAIIALVAGVALTGAAAVARAEAAPPRAGSPPANDSPEPAAEAGLLDGLIGDYAGISAAWLERVVPLAERTFALLAALEFAVSGIWWALRREGVDAAFTALLRKFVLLSFLFSLLSLFPFWVPAVVRGFEAAGQAASGTSAVNPSQVLDLGISIGGNMLASLGGLGFLRDPTGSLIASAAALLVVLAYTGIAAQICLVLVETYLVLGGGALFLGFAAFRATAAFAENYLLYAFQTGTKIYLLYLLVGVGTALSREWAALRLAAGAAGDPPSLAPHFQLLAGALIFCLLVWKIPAAAAARLTQGAAFHLGEALR